MNGLRWSTTLKYSTRIGEQNLGKHDRAPYPKIGKGAHVIQNGRSS